MQDSLDSAAVDSIPVEVLSFRAWLRGLIVPWVLVGAAVVGAAGAGIEPSSGGWPPVLIILGSFLVAWSAFLLAVVPNQVTVSSERLCRRVRRRWTMIDASDVTGIEVTPGSTSGGRRIQVRSAEARISLGLGSGRRSDGTQVALNSFIRAAGRARDDRSVGVAGPAPVIDYPSRSRRRWVSRAIAGGAALTAVVGLVTTVFGH